MSTEATHPASESQSVPPAVAVTVLAHSVGSFDADGLVTGATADFGTVHLNDGDGNVSLGVTIYNLNTAPGFTAGLAMLEEHDAGGPFSIDPIGLANLGAGDSAGCSFKVYLDTREPGVFSGTFVFDLGGQQDLPGALAGQTLALHVTGEVLPEPSAVACLFAGIGLVLRRRSGRTGTFPFFRVTSKKAKCPRWFSCSPASPE